MADAARERPRCRPDAGPGRLGEVRGGCDANDANREKKTAIRVSGR